MALKYVADGESHINEVPARDLTDGDIQDISDKWKLSIAQTEGLLIKSKLYKFAEKTDESTAGATTEIQAPKRKGR